jgi:hypothetical protein
MSQGSSAPRTFPHETVLGRARESLALCAHRLWQAGIPFAFFMKLLSAIAGPIAKAVIMAAKRIGFMAPSRMMFQTSRLWSKSATAD